MVIKTTEKKKKYDGRTTDFTLQWMVKNYGQAWETWRKLAEEWMINRWCIKKYAKKKQVEF